MAQKPKIQYVGQFYVYGSEARQLEEQTQQKKARTRLPRFRLNRFTTLYIDPVALGGLLVAALILIVMAVGISNMDECWAEYNQMSQYLTEIKRTNAELSHAYHTGYDEAAVLEAAQNAGMVPADEAQYMIITPIVRHPKPEPTMWENAVWFAEGLFAGAKTE